MFHIGHTIGIYTFIAICLGSFVYSLVHDFNDSYWDRLRKTTMDRFERQMNIVNSETFYTKDNAPSLHLTSENTDYDLDHQRGTFNGLAGTSFNSEGEQLNFQSASAFIDLKNEKAKLEQDVHFNGRDMSLDATSLDYSMKTNKLVGNGIASGRFFVPKTSDTLNLTGNKFIYDTLNKTGTFTGDVVGKVERKRQYEERVDFGTDKIDFDVNAGTVKLNGNVFLKRDNMYATSRSGEILLENYNKKLKYFSLLSDVYVKEKVVDKSGKTIYRKALSESLEWFVRDGMIVLSENPRVYQDSDTIRGNQIILRENNAVIEVDDASSNFRVETRKK